MEDYLKEQSRLFNEASEFSCPDACERFGCRDSELHIMISLVDLIGLSRACGNKVSSLFRDHCKIGFNPLEEDEPWAGRLTIELIFRKFPCFTHPATVPSRRKEILHRLLQMSAQEIFLSDFYLFGVSPFLVDLKNVAGRVLEGIEVQAEKRAVIPHHRFEALLVERLQRAEPLSHWLSRIRLLDRDEDVNEFWRTKAWTDQMTTLGGKDSSLIVHQFVGNRLEGIRSLR